MKTKENIKAKVFIFEKPEQKSKPKSFRPMRSLIATRSMKPKTNVASLTVVAEELMRRD